ncbi:hypothetical protein GQ600_21718 [Phytophthora cactorum]|nr:hypothetical protein GQ600_21718 [Phytophthora cactorum]
MSINPHCARFIATSTTTKKGDEEEEKGSFVEHLQKRRRLAAKETKYDLLYRCSSHFWPRTARSSPMTLEMILFLRETGTYWDAQTVDEATRS